MEIGGCCFPDDRLYDSEGLTWVSILDNSFTIGITQLQAFIIGKLTSIVAKQQGAEVSKGGSIAFIETRKYAGNIRTPLSCVVEQINSEVLKDPSLANRDPYGRGWIAKLRLANLEGERKGLSHSSEIYDDVEKVIQESGLRCFSVYPDYHISGIGGECPETLKILGDLLETTSPDEAVLLVTDNPHAEHDVPNWVAVRRYKILESRMEQPLKYYVIGKLGRFSS
ncbi:MAG: hypothetical protein QXT39_06700 [Conexivisphaerales archaeon]